MTTPTDKNQLIASDFNLEKLNTKQLSKHIRASLQAGSNVAVFGRRGLGKTQISKQVIKELGFHEEYINLSVFERTDIAGYPDMFSSNKDREERFINFILPRMYEKMIHGSKKVIAVLDEVDKADPSLWAPLLEFTQFRSINGRDLPNLHAVVMTGNLISEGGSRPSLPLLDRTEKYLVETNADVWLDWASQTGSIHPSVYQYITDHPTQLFGPVDANDNYADPSPRGWHNASNVVKFGEENGWDDHLINEKVSGYVGRVAGLDYKMYFTNYRVLLPLVDAIFKGQDYKDSWNKLTPTEKLYAGAIACGRLASILDASSPTNPSKEVEHALKMVGIFLYQAGQENTMLNVRHQITIQRLAKWKLMKHPDWQMTLESVIAEVQTK